MSQRNSAGKVVLEYSKRRYDGGPEIEEIKQIEMQQAFIEAWQRQVSRQLNSRKPSTMPHTTPMAPGQSNYPQQRSMPMHMDGSMASAQASAHESTREGSVGERAMRRPLPENIAPPPAAAPRHHMPAQAPAVDEANAESPDTALQPQANKLRQRIGKFFNMLRSTMGSSARLFAHWRHSAL